MRGLWHEPCSSVQSHTGTQTHCPLSGSLVNAVDLVGHVRGPVAMKLLMQVLLGNVRGPSVLSRHLCSISQLPSSFLKLACKLQIKHQRRPQDLAACSNSAMRQTAKLSMNVMRQIQALPSRLCRSSPPAKVCQLNQRLRLQPRNHSL